jgi:hypothetical protein
VIDLRGLRAMVGGATQGIGWAAACKLAELGGTVVLLGRDEAALARRVAELPRSDGQTHRYLCQDFSDPEALAEKAAAHLAEFGDCTILVNNTGDRPAGRSSMRHRRPLKPRSPAIWSAINCWPRPCYRACSGRRMAESSTSSPLRSAPPSRDWEFPIRPGEPSPVGPRRWRERLPGGASPSTACYRDSPTPPAWASWPSIGPRRGVARSRRYGPVGSLPSRQVGWASRKKSQTSSHCWPRRLPRTSTAWSSPWMAARPRPSERALASERTVHPNRQRIRTGSASASTVRRNGRRAAREPADKAMRSIPACRREEAAAAVCPGHKQGGRRVAHRRTPSRPDAAAGLEGLAGLAGPT